MLQGIPHTMVYMHDILITGRTQDEHCHNLETVLSRLTQAGLRLKRNKCVFFQKKVAYIGIQNRQKRAFTLMERQYRQYKTHRSQKNVQELRAYLGLINYYDDSCRDCQYMTYCEKESSGHGGENKKSIRAL